MIHIVTDSTADIPATVLAELAIHVVPCFIMFDSESFLDGVDMTRDQFYARLAGCAQLPTTSTPSIGQFTELYSRVARPGDEIISLHVSGPLSSICNSARLGAQEVPEVRVHVVDSGSTSMGLGWQVIAAARAAHQGQRIADILSLLNRMRERVYVFAALDTMEFLRRSGRVDWARAFLGQVLNVKPIVRLYQDVVTQAERVRTHARSQARLIELVTQLGRLEALAVMHTAAPAMAEALAQQVAGFVPAGMTLPIVEVTPVIGVHVGPKGTGLAAVVAEAV